MKNCPKCKKEIQDGLPDCPYCGIFFEKWEKMAANAAAAGQAAPAGAEQTPSPEAPAGRGSKAWLYTGCAAILLAAGYFLLRGDPTPPDRAFTNYLSAMRSGDYKAAESALSVSKLAEMKTLDVPFESVLAMIAGQQPKDAAVKQEADDGKTASLRLEGTGPLGGRASGSVEMVREDGRWKVNEESWLEDASGAANSSLPAADPAQNNPLVGKWREDSNETSMMAFNQDGTLQSIEMMEDASDPSKKYAQASGIGRYRLIDATHLEISAGPQKEICEIKLEGDTLTMISEGQETVMHRYVP